MYLCSVKQLVIESKSALSRSRIGRMVAVCVLSFIIVAVAVDGYAQQALWGAAIAALTAAVYGRSRFFSVSGCAVLTVALSLSYAGALYNIWWFTDACGGTPAMPVLDNFDASIDWHTADTLAQGSLDYDGIVRNYGILVGGFLWLLGFHVAVPVMLNVMCYGLLLIAMGAIGWELSGSRRMSTITMLLTASISYLTVQSTVIIKDVPLTLCMAVTVVGMLRIRSGKFGGAADFVLLFLALAFMAFLRPNSMPFVPLGALLLALGSDKRTAMGFVALSFVAMGLSMATRYGLMRVPGIVEQLAVTNSSDQQFFSGNSMPWDSIIGRYDQLSLWQKLAWLPASVGVQFLIPLPWNYLSYINFGPTVPYAHFGFAWYFSGALAVYAVAREAVAPNSGHIRLALWGMACTVVTAYLTSGHTSRYCLTFLPMILPAAAYALWVYGRDRSLHIWLGTFSIILVSVLSAAYYIYAYQ